MLVDTAATANALFRKIKGDFIFSNIHFLLVNCKSLIKFFKVASGDLNNIPLLKEISKTKKKVVISTGMSTLEEVKHAISFFNKKNVTLLHCISCYPTKNKDANLINIILDREVVPEFIQENCQPVLLKKALTVFLEDKDAGLTQIKDARVALEKLGRNGPSPSGRAANVILSMLNKDQ